MSRHLASDTEARLRRQLKAAVAGILLLACLLAVFSWRIVQQRAEDADWAARTLAVRASLELTLRHLDEVETGARGFSMTGEPAFMGPYESGEHATQLDLETLRRLIVNSPSQELRLRKLVEQANNRIESATGLAAERRTSGQTPTLAQIDHDKVTMDAARATIQEMEDGENRLLAQRILSAQRARQFTRYTISFILGAILLSIAAFLFRRRLSRAASALVQATAREADLQLRVDQRTAGLKAHDLEIRKLNEDLEGRIVTRTAELLAANQELQSFSYSISHDLRAPLRHISGFARILINDFSPSLAPEAKDHLQRIREAILRMDLMVDGLLSLATLGRQPLQLQCTALNAIVDRVLLVLQPEWEARNVEWHIAHLPQLECDPVLMSQVLQNLISNALKYSRGQPTAVIQIDSLQRPGEPVIIFVRDNGAGFNMRYAEKLFGVFQRMHTESEFEGTGIGLATVQRIIQKHGGSVWAESAPNHGATFYFTLGQKAPTGMVRQEGADRPPQPATRP